jgi:2,5-diamino-6-(ribosylamino)-4(3H)-pyrimidinone 5'-phosphate reductase
VSAPPTISNVRSPRSSHRREKGRGRRDGGQGARNVPKSEIQNLKSRIQVPGREVGTPHSALRTPQSARSALRTPRAALPEVVLNMSMTADGKIATANRVVESFSSRRDHDELLKLRATADAVLCGARTAMTEGVTLGPGGAKYRRLRLRRGLAEYHLRIIVSGSGRVDTRAEVFRHRFSPIIVLTSERVSAARLAGLRRAADDVAVFGTKEVDLPAALHWLRQRWKVKRLICEGGGELNDAMFRAGLVDELRLTICPIILGGATAPTIADGQGFRMLAEAARFKVWRSRRVGDELFVVLRRAP